MNFSPYSKLNENKFSLVLKTGCVLIPSCYLYEHNPNQGQWLCADELYKIFVQ